MTETWWSKGKTLVFELRTKHCCSCRPWLVGLCSFRYLNIRKLLTRYLPILVLFGLWHFMVTTRYTRQQTRPAQLPKNVVGTPEKYRAIIARLNKERQNLHRQVVLMYQADKVSPTSGQFNEVGKKILQKKRQHSRTFRKMMLMKQKKASKEATLMDKLVEDLKKQNIPSIETYKQILGNEIYGTRIAKIISEASNAIHNASVLDDSRATNIRTSPAVIPRHAKSYQLHFTTISRNETNLQESTDKTNYTLCDPFPPGLLGRVFVDFDHTHNMTREDVLKQHPDIEFGGTWQPPNCVARHRVAIIIPYRDREQHLVTLLSHLLPILKRQELNFHVFVTEQTGNDTFNKARIMNAAFKEAIKLYDFQCFVFHDVDLIPEDDRNMYSCPVQPRHMSVAIDEMGYRVPYDYLVGGVLSMRTEHFQMVNGYSNLYWGWGAEDDDLAFRILHVGLKITRPPSKVARYKMIKHEKRTPTDWRKRSRLLRTGVRRFNFDGLNSVNYNLISITKTPLFTHVLVDIGKPPSLT